MDNPKYGIELDEAGVPLKFFHAKLFGVKQGISKGPGNVGVWVYRTQGLLDVVNQVHQDHFDPAHGYSGLGNESAEFSLDNICPILAHSGRMRILSVADIMEIIRDAKTVGDIPQFMEALAQVLRNQVI
jgi:hypothetical protein